MSCEHSLAERETACADGYCPICLAAERESYKETMMSRHDDAVRLRRERDALTRTLRDVCIGHPDDCACAGCKLSFARGG
jgi:hypothetical protein